MIYMIYKEKNISETNKLIGCLSLKIENDIVKDFKFKFEEIDIDLKFPLNWTWVGNTKFVETFDFEDSKLPSVAISIINDYYLKEFEDKINLILNNDLPEFINLTESDISKKFLLISGNEASEFELSIAKSLILFKILSFFSNNPEKTFDFPLYLEYIEKESVDITVEDFLILILNSSEAII